MARRFQGGGRADYRVRWAVIVGINAYRGGTSGLAPLDFAVNDARELRDLLRDEFGFAPENTLFLTDAEATRARIRAAFTRWLPGRGPGPDDALFVFFAGHGLVGPGGEGYLAAADSSARDIRGTCVSVSALREWMLALPCRHKAVVLDSCYSGRLFGPGAGPRRRPGPTLEAPITASGARGPGGRAAADPLAYYHSRPAFWGMSAGRDTPVADGSGRGRHSVFTAALLQVLRERADSPRRQDHAFTFRQVAARVEGRVANALGSRQVPDWGKLDEGDGDLVFRPTVKRATPAEQADYRRESLRHSRYALTLGRVQRLCRSAPARALALLEDSGRCPPELREFAWGYYVSQCRREPPPLGSHDGWVLCLAVSPDGRLLASGGSDRVVRLWSLDRRRQLAALEGHSGAVTGVAFSPDGKTLASTAGLRDILQLLPANRPKGPAGELKLWDAATGKPLRTVAAPAAGFAAVAWSSKGELATGSLREKPQWEGEVTVWDAAAGKALRSWTVGQKDFASVLAFSPDGESLAAGGRSALGGAALWEAATGKQRWKMAAGAVEALLFTPDGKELISASTLAPVQVWDTATGKRLRALKAADFQAHAWSAALSGDGKVLAVGCHVRPLYPEKERFEVVLWDHASGREAGRLAGPSGRPRALAFPRQGGALYGGGEDGFVRGWGVDPPSARRLAGVELPRASFLFDSPLLAWSNDARRIAVQGDKGVELRDTDGKAGPTRLRLDGTIAVRSLEFSPDGSLVATGAGTLGKRGPACLWDARTGELVRKLAQRDDFVRVQAFSPDGRLVATTAGPLPIAQNEVRVWEVATGQLARSFRHPAPVDAVAFHPAEPVLAAACRERTVQLWGLRDGALLATLEGHQAPPNVLAFSPHGKLLASGDGLKAVRLWDVATRQELISLDELPGRPSRLLFLSEGRTLAAGCVDGQVCLFNAATGLPLATLTGPKAAVLGLTTRDEGQALVAADARGSVWAWETASSGRTTLYRHNQGVAALAVSRDGVLLSASGRSARFWELESGRETAASQAHERAICQAAFSPDGALAATAARASNFAKVFLGQPLPGEVVLWAASTGRPRARATLPAGNYAAVAFSPDGGLLAAAAGDDPVTVTSRGKPLTGMAQLYDALTSTAPIEESSTGRPWGLLQLWDVPSWKVKRAIRHDRPLLALAYSPDGKSVAAGDDLGQVLIWSAGTGKRLALLRLASTRQGLGLRYEAGQQGLRVTAVVPNSPADRAGFRLGDRVTALGPAGGELVPAAGMGLPEAGKLMAARDGARFEVVPAGGGKPQARLVKRGEVTLVEGGAVRGLAYSPDGRALAAAMADGAVRLWPASGQGGPRLLSAHKAGATAVAFSPDGKLLASAGRDRLVRLWRVRDGAALKTLAGHAGPVWALAFTPEGGTLLTASDDRTVRLWQVGR